jgi:hypothetical protein
VDSVQLRTPPDIARLIQKGASSGLTPSERAVLSGYAMQERGRESPDVLGQIEQVLRQAQPMDPTGMVSGSGPMDTSAQPSVAERVAETMRSNDVDPVGAVLNDPGGAVGGAITAGLAPGSPVSAWDIFRGAAPNPRDALAEIPEDALAAEDSSTGPLGIGGYAKQLSELAAGQPMGTPTQAAADPPVDETQGERRKRRKTERTDPTLMPEGAIGPGSSSFADLSPAYAKEVSQNPALMAQMIAEQMGGGATTALLIQPEVERAMRLMDTGVIGTGRGKLGRSIAPDAAGSNIDAVVDWVKMASGGVGGEVNTQGLYQDTLRRAVRTDPAELTMGASGGYEALKNQVEVTKGALLTTVTDQTTYDLLNSRIDAASVEWFKTINEMSKTVGPAAAEQLTFPQFLKQHGGMNLMTKAPRERGRNRRREEAVP